MNEINLITDTTEDKQAYENFEIKLNDLSITSENLTRLFKTFSWKVIWFQRADQFLIAAGYIGDKDTITKIHVFIKEKIESTGILTFNKFLISIKSPAIDNHIDWLKVNPDKIDWVLLSKNPSAIDLLHENLDKIFWPNLSKNPSAIDLLRENLDKIFWPNLLENPAAIDLLHENPEKLNWVCLSKNLITVDLLHVNPNKIEWEWLSLNSNTVDLLHVNPNKTERERLSLNSNTIDLLQENPDKINWSYLSSNSYDYKKEKIAAFNLLNLLKFSRMKII